MEVQPYVKALQERTSASTSPVKFQTPHSDKKRKNAKSLSSNFKSTLLQNEMDELTSLREENDRLHKHINVQNENFAELQKSFINVQQQLNQERQSTIDTFKLLTDLRNSLSIEKEKSSTLIQQIDQLDNIIKTRQQLYSSRDEMTQRLQNEYHDLVADYNHVVETVASQAKQIREQRNKIRDLESQLRNTSQSPIRSSNTFDFEEKPKYKSYSYDDNGPLRISVPDKPDFRTNYQNQQNDDDFYNDFGSGYGNQYSATVPSPNINEFKQKSPNKNSDFSDKQNKIATPVRLSSVFVGDYSPLKSPEKSQAPFAIGNEDSFEPQTKNNRSSPARNHPALQDNISFDSNQNAFHDDSYQNIDEMKKQMDDLIIQKEFIESMLNTPQSRSISAAQHMRERQQWEQKLETVMKQLSSVRLQLRRMREL
ncbi:hypothetical protein TVAG_257500 [Trichomonas vaginalis G3]|uniref:Uncharacterized protein n=1 Tax=Trichomonas vaginalis (strain ATCC PRA-98 / G3) TaxID=412133 RepID=A2ELI4_TRIV3|nr:hypothetical protein TVAGG3_0005060 [Trichomonas vaginalis G3]EAY06511.1 hypothetical protein TVAG_257500 [Trichomonas vaginalis G3]KAI5538853.1 hypothetical protein TVAGG3_0005060 [Trichomonas vaginalis G3]|eukprot:XP_001318734.1 hypothetical protein [Trichomonas vaginalis G3]